MCALQGEAGARYACCSASAGDNREWRRCGFAGLVRSQPKPGVCLLLSPVGKLFPTPGPAVNHPPT